MLEFLTKFEFLNKIFGRGESRQTAKERLRLVLIHDRASLTPQLMESLKEDLIHIISKYLEIDVNELEIGLEQKDGSIALAANIPIKKVKRAPEQSPVPAPAAEKKEETGIPGPPAEKSLPPSTAEKAPASPAAPRDKEQFSKKRASQRGKKKSRIKRLSEQRGGPEQKPQG